MYILPAVSRATPLGYDKPLAKVVVILPPVVGAPPVLVRIRAVIALPIMNVGGVV